MKAVAEYFKNNKNSFDKEEYYKLLIRPEIAPEDCIRMFLETFAFGIKINVSESLLDLPNRMVEEDIINHQDFIYAFNTALKNIYLRACDSAFIHKFLAKVLIDLHEKRIVYIDELNLERSRKDFTEDDDPEEYEFFMNELSKEISKLQKKE